MKVPPVSYSNMSNNLVKYIGEVTNNDPYGYLLDEIDGVEVDNDCTPQHLINTLKEMDNSTLTTLFQSLL